MEAAQALLQALALGSPHSAPEGVHVVSSQPWGTRRARDEGPVHVTLSRSGARVSDSDMIRECQGRVCFLWVRSSRVHGEVKAGEGAPPPPQLKAAGPRAASLSEALGLPTRLPTPG